MGLLVKEFTVFDRVARMAWLIVAISALVTFAVLGRYTIVVVPNEYGRAYRLDRLTGETIILVEGKRAEVVPFGAK
jgi:hypothetical protein